MPIYLKVQTQNLRGNASSIKQIATNMAGIHDDLIQVTNELDYDIKQLVSRDITTCLDLLQDNYNLVGNYGREIMNAADAYDKER